MKDATISLNPHSRFPVHSFDTVTSEHLLCARPCSSLWDFSLTKSPGPALKDLLLYSGVCVEGQTNKQNKYILIYSTLTRAVRSKTEAGRGADRERRGVCVKGRESPCCSGQDRTVHEMQENPAGAGRVATRRKSILGERHNTCKGPCAWQVLGTAKEARVNEAERGARWQAGKVRELQGPVGSVGFFNPTLCEVGATGGSERRKTSRTRGCAMGKT